MCGICGCSPSPSPEHSRDDENVSVRSHVKVNERVHARSHSNVDEHEHEHEHEHEQEDEDVHGRSRSHSHSHSHAASSSRVMEVQAALLAGNDRFAAENRGFFRGRGVFSVNLVSSPGAGKTTLLERTLRDLGAENDFAVIEGDQATSRDAERIRATGCTAVQINTGAGCHLDAHMVSHAIADLRLSAGATLFIENVGNLVCPALFDLGEHSRAVIFSVTEGEDKPLKYPHIFRSSHVVVLTKIDLLPYVAFDLDRAIAHAHEVNPRIEIVAVSATTGEGMEHWYDWLHTRSDHHETGQSPTPR